MLSKLIKLSKLMLIGSLLMNVAIANEQDGTRIYANEQAIVFETMDGLTTDAFSGFMLVPENRNNPKSRMITVKYVRFPATGKSHVTPIIYLSGGPGGSGIDTAKYPNFRFPLFMALREFGDVIALDQRGTGASNDTPKCVSSQVIGLTDVLTEPLVTQRYQQAVTECVAFWQSKDIDVLGYTTVQSALDINDLRLHFKAEKVTLWGISYGSHLALAAMKIMPDNIDKVVMASAEGLNQTVKLPAQTDAYFGRLQQAINTQPAAAAQFPDIIAMIKRVHKRLGEKPMLVGMPQKDGASKDLLLQTPHLQGMASALVADPHRGVGHLLALYFTLDKGSDVVLQEMLKHGFINDEPITLNLMSTAMDIASGISDERLALVNQQAKTALLGAALNFPMPLLNKAIANLDLGDDFRQGPVNNIPTLLLTGTLDGRTYIEGQQEATAGLKALTQVMVVNGGHNVFMLSPKVTDVIKTFLKGEAVTTAAIEVDLPSFAMKH
ncbi:alpha/beta fold hydrolase [Alteromonadaceae bacterium BrNp21-10]|nr:alpha/beta fold hydrolase [Alteromonadaceae bacterium BrNp21-10]